MMSKKQFAKSIIDDAKKEGVTNIYQSSRLAVAMEFLDLLTTQEDKDYVASRGGTEYISVDPVTGLSSILSTREILELLPNTMEYTKPEILN